MLPRVLTVLKEKVPHGVMVTVNGYMVPVLVVSNAICIRGIKSLKKINDDCHVNYDSKS